MIMVVTGHYFGDGGLSTSPITSSFNHGIATLLTILSIVAVNCFFLITGFFVTPSNEPISYAKTTVKVLGLWVRVTLYGIVIYLLFVTFGLISYCWNEFLPNIFPWTTNRYWFFTVYLEVMLLLPFIKRLLAELTVKEVSYLIILLCLFDMFIPLFGYHPDTNGYNIIHGLTMTCIGYGLRLNPSKLRTGWCIFAYILFLVLSAILTKTCKTLGVYWLEYNSPLVVASAIMLFEGIRKLNIQCNWLSRIAPHVFAIYLINDHKLRSVMYERILHCSDYYASPYMLVHFFACVTGFVILGISIDWIMSRLFFDRFIRRLGKC